MEHYRKRLGRFMRHQRGASTLREFARRTGLSCTTIHRLENAQQNVTLDTLEYLCDVFQCRIQDLMPPLRDNRHR